jgi:hypothetical protein
MTMNRQPTVSPVRMQKYLEGADYPAEKAELLACAERNGADARLLSVIRDLPDRAYAKPTDVSKAYGHLMS